MTGPAGGHTVVRHGPVALVTLARPEVRNALTPDVWAALAGTVTALDADPGVCALVLTGEDPAFCAGFDLRGLAGEDPAARRARMAEPSPFLGMLPPHDTPVVGAVNGPAVTGGLELALACDVLVASERARFADTHARVGAMPGGGLTVLLPQRIGPGRSRLMSLTGDFVDADRALAWGLVDEVVPHERLVERALEVAATMAQIPAANLAEIRRMYAAMAGRCGPDAFADEQAWAKRWLAERFDESRLAGERGAIVARGSAPSPVAGRAGGGREEDPPAGGGATGGRP